MLDILVSYLSSGEGAPSLFGDLWNYFIENYIDNTVTYANLGFGAITGKTLTTIVFAVMAAIIISLFVCLYDMRVIGAFVRKMLDAGAVGKDNALTLDALGYASDRNIYRSLRKSVRLRKVVFCAEETDYNAEVAAHREEYEKRRETENSLPSFKEVAYEIKSKDRFYIPEEQLEAAEKKFANGSVAWWIFPVTIISCIVGFFLLMILLPLALSLFDSAIGSMKI